MKFTNQDFDNSNDLYCGEIYMNRKQHIYNNEPSSPIDGPLWLKRRILPNIKAATLDKINPLRAQTAKMIFASLKKKPNMVISPATDGPAMPKIPTAEIFKPIREKPQRWFARFKKRIATIFLFPMKQRYNFPWLQRNNRAVIMQGFK